MRLIGLCFLGLMLLYQSDGKQTKEPSNTQKHGNKEYPEQQTVVIQNSVDREESEKKESAKTSQTTKETYDGVDTINAYSTAVIAVFTVLLFFGAAYQVSTARSSERAWIVLDILKAPEQLGWKNIPDWLKSIEAELIFKNTGRTPAILKNMTARCWITENPDKLPRPNYGIGQHPDIPKYGRILVPEQTLETLVTFKGNNDDPTQFIDSIKRVVSGEKKIVIYGRIIYADAFGRNQEFRFCYVWSAGKDSLAGQFGFRLGGPPEYNQQT